MLKIRIWWNDLWYTYYLKKWFIHKYDDKGYFYFKRMKKYALRLNGLEGVIS